MEEWQKQREIYKKGKLGFALGFATFFLNRCNVSGVMKGGCIGGLLQSGKYKLGCRFNPDTLAKRIERIASVAEKIHVYNMDALEFLSTNKQISKKLKNGLLYLDPPYYVKGRQLYQNHYKKSDHQSISQLMEKLDAPWIVSYDNVKEISELYKFARNREFDFPYSIRGRRPGREIMFFSDGLKIPDVPIVA